MKKRIGLVALAFLFTLASTHAQTKDFFELVKTGTPQSVQAAHDKGANVKARNNIRATPLMWAVRYNQPEVITTLLNAGADLEARDSYYYEKTALMWAAEGNEKLKGTDASRQLQEATQ